MKQRKHDDQDAESEREPEPAAPATAAGSGAATDADSGADEPARLAAELDRLTRENELLKQRLLEAAADLDNQAKRFGRERQVVRDEITARVGREMIEVLDNLDRVVGSIPERDRASPLYQGVVATQQAFLDRLRGLGIEPIDALDRPFDPFKHEAIAEVPRSDVAPGTIVDEITRGYRMGGQLVRASKVRIATAPPDPKSTTSGG